MRTPLFPDVYYSFQAKAVKKILGVMCFVCVLVFGFVTDTAFAQSTTDVYLPLVTNVRTIGGLGSPGTLRVYSSSAVPLVMGNELTASTTSPFVVAGFVEKGRFVAIAHEGLIDNQTIPVFDNTTLLTNAVQWLDNQKRQSVVFTTGHSEWIGASNSSTLRSSLQQRGFTVTTQSQTLTASLLSNVGVVVIGNAWGTFTNDELDALRGFITSGGGLLLAGLGWSWGGSTAYPMKAIGDICGIEWTKETLRDDVNNSNNAPLLTTIYPTTLAISPPIDTAIAYIKRITTENSATLPAVLQTNADIRTQYIRSVLAIGAISEDTTYSTTLRSKVGDFYQQLFADFPALFRKGTRYSATSQNTMIWIREKMFISYVNSFAHISKTLSTEHRNRIVTALGLTGTESRIVQNYGLVNLDNSALSERQKTVIEQYLKIQPANLRWLRYLVFEDFLGTPPQPAVPLYPGFTLCRTACAGGEYPILNNFIVDIGTSLENQFPTDVQPRIVSIFTSALGHEMMHNTDFNYIDKNPALQTRLVAVRQAASTNDMELLRSMVGVSFFRTSPREFIASLANEWYTDAYHTLLLGLSRFDKGFRQPINQALYITDVMSAGTDTTQFIATTIEGVVTAVPVPLVRDAQRRIIGLTYKDTTYSFTLNTSGDVTAWQKSLRAATSVANQNDNHTINVSVHPNPVQDVVSISYNLAFAADIQIELISMLGQSLTSERYGNQSPGLHALDFKIPGSTASGMYLLRVRFGNLVKMHKVMVQKQ